MGQKFSIERDSKANAMAKALIASGQLAANLATNLTRTSMDEARSHLGCNEPPEEDILAVYDILASHFPSELVCLILDEAEYWAGLSFRRESDSDDTPFSVTSSGGGVSTSCFLFSSCIPEKWKKCESKVHLRRVIFSVRGYDQGWTTDDIPVGAGQYWGSKTWFEATILRGLSDEDCKRPPRELGKLLRTISNGDESDSDDSSYNERAHNFPPLDYSDDEEFSNYEGAYEDPVDDDDGEVTLDEHGTLVPDSDRFNSSDKSNSAVSSRLTLALFERDSKSNELELDSPETIPLERHSIPLLQDPNPGPAIEQGSWHIQCHARGSDEPRTHTNVWDLPVPRSEDIVFVEESNMLPVCAITGAGHGRGFVAALRAGDCIAVFAKARDPGWVNHVVSVDIKVFYALSL